MTAIRCCALVSRFADLRVAESAAVLAEHLGRRGLEVIALAEEASRLPGIGARFVAEQELGERAQLVIAIGGDGTLLYAARLVAGRSTPLLGVNRGRLGFLTDVMPEDMLSSVDAALEGQCQRDERPLLIAELVVQGGEKLAGLALNDIVLQTHRSGHLIDFETWINGRFVNSHGGDGLVVASATGSTAYALSCGGPIVEPGLDVVVVAPICPHTLSDRPIVVSARQPVRIVLGGDAGTRAMVTSDGQTSESLTAGDTIEVSCPDWRMSLIHPRNYSYFNLLRNKLHWGRGPSITPAGP